MSHLRLSRIDPHQAPDLQQYPDRTIYQTREWIEFIAHAQCAEPVTAIVNDGICAVGLFSGLIVKKLGMRILGSPFPGWTTSYMGFNLEPSVERVDALRALEEFAFNELGCIHIEIMDRRLSISDFEKTGYLHTNLDGFEVDLARDEKEIFDSMDPACRRAIRKGVKCGVRVETASDLQFVDEYYSQLMEVFTRKNLVPTYPKERVRLLAEYLLPTGRLLLARALNDQGKCVATGIFPAFNDTMYFWGGASRKEDQLIRPNEALHWFAMRFWRSRGMTKYDMGGVGEYKRKYGGREISIPWGRKSRFAIINSLRQCSREAYRVRQHVTGFIAKLKPANATVCLFTLLQIGSFVPLLWKWLRRDWQLDLGEMPAARAVPLLPGPDTILDAVPGLLVALREGSVETASCAAVAVAVVIVINAGRIS